MSATVHVNVRHRSRYIDWLQFVIQMLIKIDSVENIFTANYIKDSKIMT